MDNRLFWRLEVIGAAFTYILGLFLHNCYYIFQQRVWAILFCSVNNSVWEHVKVFTMPYIVWCLIELCFIQQPFKKLIVSKIIGLYFLIISTIIVFSLYFAIIGRSSFIFDFICVGILVSISFYISYRLINSQVHIEKYFYICLTMLALFLSVYLVFTVNPPKLNLFKDPFTGLYGFSTTYQSAYTFIVKNFIF